MERQWVINAFESGIFPMRGVHHDDDYHYIYDDEFYLKEISTPKKPGTPITQAPPPVALDPPPPP